MSSPLARVRALHVLCFASCLLVLSGCGSPESAPVDPEGTQPASRPTTPPAAAAEAEHDAPAITGDEPAATDAPAAAAAPAPEAAAPTGGAEAGAPSGAAATAPGVGAPAAARAHGPLPAAIRAHFEAIRSDPAPPAIVRSSHYYRTNENAHYVYRERVSDLGGVMTGVGSDQLYLLAGWARPEILVPLDFDAEITLTHRVFAAAFLASDTADALFALFDEESLASLLGLVQARYANDPDLESLLRTTRRAAGPLRDSLRSIRRRYREFGVPTYLTDAAQYEFVRGLFVEGRVFPVRGDLTADNAMLDLALAARRASLPLRLIYVSNAETYFEFGPAYRRNIAAQPFDERSVFLRTFHSNLEHPNGEPNYHYNIETGPHAAAMMLGSSISSVRTLLVQARSRTGVRGLSEIIAAPVGGPQPIAPLPAGHGLAALWTPPAAAPSAAE